MPSPSTAEAILDRLVSFNTVSRNSNLLLIEFIGDYLSSYNVRWRTIHDETGQKANLVASIGPLDRPGILLSGHTDVVPVEGQEWTRDPFKLTREGGRLYGRGTTDMKGFLACVLASVPQMASTELQIPIHIVFSYDEEVGCHGARQIVQHIGEAMTKPLACFVGEPTAMAVIDGHKGSAGLLTAVVGKSCHSSRPDLGVNAIFHASDLIAELRRQAEELTASPEEASSFEIPYTTLSVGVIQGGTVRNSIPGQCHFQWDIRATRSGIVAGLVERFETFATGTVLPAMQARAAEASITTTFVYDMPPLVAQTGSIAEVLGKRFAVRNATGSVGYASEAGLFQAAGIPTVLCGPGNDSEAHATDEWIAAEQLQRCMDFLENLIVHVRAG